MPEESIIYNVVYSDGTSGKAELGELINRGGAAGKIYLNNSSPNSVAKIFHNKNKSSTNRKKLESMLLNRPKFAPLVKDGVEYAQIAWPEAILEDDEGFCVGYLMPFIKMNEAVSLDHLMQKATRKKLKLTENYAHRIFAAYNMAAMVTALHKCGHYIVDLKPSNVFVYKENMMVAMVDCDGFSIQGERSRYPAEFVSEEYIYPEGMAQGCDEMGEEQDKFAMAVIIFKLLNNGIHPFSGVPRKADGEMLTIQNRIERYHYAYGLWPDTYQSPAPYSIHEYFDKKTLEMFERAFTKSGNRPTAYEWQEHLWKLLHSLKDCKKNHDHVYFTSKGCGLCMSEEKFAADMLRIKRQKETPETIRGVEVSELLAEQVEKKKAEANALNNKVQNITIALIGAYLLFFGLLYKILSSFSDYVIGLGLGLQGIFFTLVMAAIYYTLRKYENKIPLLQKYGLPQMLMVYAFICIITALISINRIPGSIFHLAGLPGE